MNVAQLTAALQALVRETPGVDVRYVFDDENGLVKRPAGSAPLPVSLRQVEDEQHAMGCLLQAQATPFELESEAPLRCLLLLTPGDDVILGVVLHDILAETLPWRHLPAMLSARYNGDVMPLSFAVAPVELAETSEPQLPWVRQAVSLQDYRSPAQRLKPCRRWARAWSRALLARCCPPTTRRGPCWRRWRHGLPSSSPRRPAAKRCSCACRPQKRRSASAWSLA